MEEKIAQYDILGHEVKVGSIVLYSDGKHTGQRAFLVKKLSPRMVSVHGGKSFCSSTLVVVDDIVKRMTEEQLMYLIEKSGKYGPYIIGGLKEPSEELLVMAVKKNKDALYVIQDPNLQTLIKLISGI